MPITKGTYNHGVPYHKAKYTADKCSCSDPAVSTKLLLEWTTEHLPTAISCQSLASRKQPCDQSPKPSTSSHYIAGILIVANFREVASCHCCLSPSIAAAAPGTAKVSFPPTDRLWIDGYTNNPAALAFMWVLLFRKLVATTLISTYIPRVLVIDGYLYSQVYGMDHACSTAVLYEIQISVSVLV